MNNPAPTPATSVKQRVLHGSALLVTNASNLITISFSTAFPVQCDSIVTGCPINGSSGYFFLTFQTRAANLATFSVATFAGAAPGAGFSCAFDWIAFGH